MGDDEATAQDGNDSETDEPFVLETAPAFESDRLFFRMVAVALGAAIILSVAGSICLAAYGKDVPESVVAIGSASVGALAGVLTVRQL